MSLLAFGFTEVFVLIVVAVGLFAAFNWRSFVKTAGAGRAQLGKVGRAAEDADPLAMYQQAIDDSLANVGEASESHVESGTLVKSLERQVADDHREKQRLTDRIKRDLEKGRHDSAKENALSLAAVEKSLAKNELQLEKARSLHERQTTRVVRGQQNIAEKQQTARNLGVELRQSETAAKLAELDQKYNPNALNGRVAEFEEAVKQRIDANLAKVDSVETLSSQGQAQQEAEDEDRNDEAEAILERFRTPAPADGININTGNDRR